MDISSFSDDNFDTKAWINNILQSEIQDKKENYTMSLVMKLQLYVQQVNNALEETSQHVLANLPKIMRDTKDLQEEALILKDKMSIVKEEIIKIEQDTGKSIDSIEKLDRTKTKLHEAKLGLHESDNWTVLAERLGNWTVFDKQNAWELSGQFEGDMILNAEQKYGRNGLLNTYYRWPKNQLVYAFDGSVSEQHRNLVRTSLQEYSRKTCVSARESYASEPNIIVVSSNQEGCWSLVGRQGGAQQLNLQANGCMYKNTIIHEFMHALGFYHQQSATERDQYITIHWENIEKGMEHNFDKYDSNTITNFQTIYDYSSIMHYSEYAFSSNGQMTMEPKNGNHIIVLDGMSNTDATKVNRMYC